LPVNQLLRKALELAEIDLVSERSTKFRPTSSRERRSHVLFGDEPQFDGNLVERAPSV